MSLYDDASLILYPSGYKEDKIYSLKPTDGSGDLTFTRASSATRVNSDGLIETASVFGSEEVTNGDFATDTDWNKGSGSTISGGNLNIISAPYNATTRQTISLTSGITYQILINATAVGSATANTFQLGFGDSSGTPSSATQHEFAVGISTKTLTATASATDTTIIFRSRDAGTSNLTIHSVSVKEVITSNVPRIDYTGGGCGKLLLEPQRTNLALYSEQFDNAIWTKSNVTISANNTTSPDGTQNADLIYPTLSSSNLGVYQNTTGVTGVVGTVSCYVKSAGKNWALLGTDNGSSYNVSFDLVNGVVGSVPTGYTATIESVGNGWYRITATFQSGYSQAYPFVGVADNTNRSVTADGTNGLYIWGFQTEIASYVSSYIPTLASSVTRLADAASKTGISSLFGTNQGTFLMDFVYSDKSIAYGQFLFDVTDSTNYYRLLMYSEGGGTTYDEYSLYDSDGGVVATYNLYQNTRYKIGIKYNSTAIYWYINGSLVATGGAFGYQMAQIYLAQRYSLAENVAINLNQALVFPTALTNAQLETLTTI